MCGPEAIRRVIARRAVLWAGLAALAWPLAAQAVLGEGLASLRADSLRMGGAHRLDAGAAGPVQVIALADGSTVRQYLSPSGLVYAVAWNTHFKPRLDQLLGSHFPAYAEAGRRALQQRPGIVHHWALRQGDLVVESSAHLTAHVGRAYLRSLLPPGSVLDAIR